MPESGQDAPKPTTADSIRRLEALEDQLPNPKSRSPKIELSEEVIALGRSILGSTAADIAKNSIAFSLIAYKNHTLATAIFKALVIIARRDEMHLDEGQIKQLLGRPAKGDLDPHIYGKTHQRRRAL